MVCKKFIAQIIGVSMLIIGLWSLQKSHELHIAKQRNLSGIERQQVIVENVSREEGKYETMIKRYECLSGAFLLLSIMSFLLSPFLGNGVTRRVR